MKALLLHGGLLALLLGLAIGTAVRADPPDAQEAQQAADDALTKRDGIAADALAALNETEPYKAALAALAGAQQRLQKAHDAGATDTAAQAQAVLDAQTALDHLERGALQADPAWVAADAEYQQAQSALRAAKAQQEQQRVATDQARQQQEAAERPQQQQQAAMQARMQQQQAAAQARQPAAPAPGPQAQPQGVGDVARQQQEIMERIRQAQQAVAQGQQGGPPTAAQQQQLEQTVLANIARGQQQTIARLQKTDPRAAQIVQQIVNGYQDQLALQQQYEQQAAAPEHAHDTPQQKLALKVKYYLASFQLTQKQLAGATTPEYQARQKMVAQTIRQLQDVSKSLEQPNLTATQLADANRQIGAALGPSQQLLAQQQQVLDAEAKQRQEQADEQAREEQERQAGNTGPGTYGGY